MSEEDNRRLLFVDLETGGLDEKENPLLEIGMRCECSQDDPDAVEFSAVIQHSVESWSRCSESALKVNQFTFGECMLDGLPLDIVADNLALWLYTNGITADTVIWVGQNPSFDERFLYHNMGSHLEFIGLFPLKRIINVMDLAKELKWVNPSFKPVSLSGANISLALGVQPEDNVHRAMGGVHALRRNYYRLTELLNKTKSTEGVN